MPHTPAPWHDDGYRIYAPTDDADKRNGRVIVEYKHCDGFNLDDAPLLQAAPDLLEVLRALLAARDNPYVMLGGEDEAGRDLWADAERAVDKATGAATR